MITLLIFDAQKSILAPEERTKKRNGFWWQDCTIATINADGVDLAVLPQGIQGVKAGS